MYFTLEAIIATSLSFVSPESFFDCSVSHQLMSSCELILPSEEFELTANSLEALIETHGKLF